MEVGCCPFLKISPSLGRRRKWGRAKSGRRRRSRHSLKLRRRRRERETSLPKWMGGGRRWGERRRRKNFPLLRKRKSGIGRGDSRTPLNNGLTPARVAATLPPFQLAARIGREKGKSSSLSPSLPRALPSCAWSHNRRAFLLLPLHACHPPR